MASAKTNPKPDLVKVRLPKAPKGEDNYEVVGLNGKLWKVPRGKEVEVPKAVHELLMRQQAYRDDLIDVQNDIPNE